MQETGLTVFGKDAFIEVESRPMRDLPVGSHYLAFAGLVEIDGPEVAVLGQEHVDLMWHPRGEPFRVDLTTTTMNALYKYNQFGVPERF